MSVTKIKLIFANLVIPLNLVKLTADAIDYEIPLLLSEDSMKKVNAMTDFKNDKMIMFQYTRYIIHNDSGHYGILLNNFNKKDEFIDHQFFIFVLVLKSKFQEQKKKTAAKLHQQFANPSGDKLIGLVKKSDVND